MKRMKSVAGFGGESSWRRVQSAIAHTLVYVLAVGLVVRVTTWFGLFIGANQIITLILLVSWMLSGRHRRQEHLCARCVDEVPADAPTRAERQRPLLCFSHLANTVKGIAILGVLMAGPPLLSLMTGDVARLMTIPGDLWLFATIYTEWVHHRLRPWCPYCDPWDDDGDEEPSPDPTILNIKTGR